MKFARVVLPNKSNERHGLLAKILLHRNLQDIQPSGASLLEPNAHQFNAGLDVCALKVWYCNIMSANLPWFLRCSHNSLSLHNASEIAHFKVCAMKTRHMGTNVEDLQLKI